MKAYPWMTPSILWRAMALAAALLAAKPAVAAQVWELSPAQDPSVPIGTYTVVGGKTSPAGVIFALKNNNIDSLVALTLIAKNGPLHLSAFKDDGQAFLDKDTDAQGILTIRFRTGDVMDFKVSGQPGAGYELSVWRSPPIHMPGPDPIVSMASVTGKAEAAATPPAGASGSPALARIASGGAGIGPLIYILLGGILFALIVIAGLIYRGQKARGKS